MSSGRGPVSVEFEPLGMSDSKACGRRGHGQHVHSEAAPYVRLRTRRLSRGSTVVTIYALECLPEFWRRLWYAVAWVLQAAAGQAWLRRQAREATA